MPNGNGVRWAECLLIMGTGCRVQVFSLILDSSVGLSAGIQSAWHCVSETFWVRILHSAEEDNLSPFDSKIACLCQSIEINNMYVCMYACMHACMYVCVFVCVSVCIWYVASVLKSHVQLKSLLFRSDKSSITLIADTMTVAGLATH